VPEAIDPASSYGSLLPRCRRKGLAQHGQKDHLAHFA